VKEGRRSKASRAPEAVGAGPVVPGPVGPGGSALGFFKGGGGPRGRGGLVSAALVGSELFPFPSGCLAGVAEGGVFELELASSFLVGAG
jgi:hypothetical protein